MDLIQQIAQDEGFRDHVYKCPTGFWTFGHGHRFITEEQSLRMLAESVDEIRQRLLQAHDWLADRPEELLEVLIQMVFQLGWDGCHNFRMTWAAIREGDYQSAADEMLDSKWARSDSPGRAKRLSDIVRNLK